MGDQPSEYRAALPPRDGLLAIIVLITSVYGCSIYANLSFVVRRPADFRFFPPFRPYVDANENRGLAGENLNIARSLTAGQGFSHPFDGPSGPTAWMPPVLPGMEAGLLWICAGDRDAVMAVVIFLQINVLIATGLLVILLIRQTTRLGTVPAVMVFLVVLLGYFGWCFQNTQDCWLVMLAVDLLIAGFCWWRPLACWSSAAGWGVLGGLCALVNPIVGLTWGTCSVVVGVQRRSWSGLGLTLLVAGLTLTPWTARNYLVFGRLIPIKSNLAYELYHDAKAMATAHPEAGLIFVCNPNNPTGTVTRKDDIDAIVANKPKGCVVLVDEAYLHFAPSASPATDLVAAGKDVIVLRTFSKLYGMAGLRAGAALGRPDLLDKMRALAGLNFLPATGMVGATASLKNKALVGQRRGALAEIRKDLFAWLDRKGYAYIPSEANMVLIDSKRPGRETAKAMLAHKVAIGRCWAALPTHVRVTIGTAGEMEKFKAAFERVVRV